MGLKIRETSGIQRNLPTRTNIANNLHQQAAGTLSNSSNSIVTSTTGNQGYQDSNRGFILHTPSWYIGLSLKKIHN